MPLNKELFSYSRRKLLLQAGQVTLAALSAELLACAEPLLRAPPQALSPGPESRGFAIAKSSADEAIAPHHLEHGPSSSALILACFDGQSAKEIPLPFYPHQTSQNPLRHSQLITVQKWGAQGACIDFHTEKVSLLALPQQHLFFGHSAFSPDGEFIFISSMNFKTGLGEILVYNSRDLTLHSSFLSGGVLPHDLQISHDQKSLFVINAPFNSRVTPEEEYKSLSPTSGRLVKFDLSTGKLVNTIDLYASAPDSEPFKSYGHFLNQNDHDFLFIGTDQSATVLSLLQDGRFINLDQDPLAQGCNGETLSNCPVADDKALVTNPDSSRTFLVDLKQKKILKSFHLAHCKGIVSHPDQEHFLIFHTEKSAPTFSVFSRSTMDLVQDKTTLANLKGILTPHLPRGAHGSGILWPT